MNRVVVLGIITAGVWIRSAAAELPVYFPDQDLKEAVEAALGTVDPTPMEMLSLTALTCKYHSGAMDLTGLEYAVNLEVLDLTQNGIWHIEPLSKMTHLKWLDLNNNKISDLSALAGLSQLEYLNLHQNRIQDLSPLSGLAYLKGVYLYDNQIADISPLSGLTSLKELVLKGNWPSVSNPRSREMTRHDEVSATQGQSWNDPFGV